MIRATGTVGNDAGCILIAVHPADRDSSGRPAPGKCSGAVEPPHADEPEACVTQTGNEDAAGAVGAHDRGALLLAVGQRGARGWPTWIDGSCRRVMLDEHILTQPRACLPSEEKASSTVRRQACQTGRFRLHHGRRRLIRAAVRPLTHLVWLERLARERVRGPGGERDRPVRSDMPQTHCTAIGTGDECAAAPIRDDHGVQGVTDRDRPPAGRPSPSQGAILWAFL